MRRKEIHYLSFSLNRLNSTESSGRITILKKQAVVFSRGGGGGREKLRYDHYVSKENNLGPDDKIRYIWGLKGPILYL